MASAVAPPATPKTTTSVDPLYTAAVAQAKAALAAETQPIKDEQSSSDATAQQRETDATGVAAALSKLLQPIGPAINGMYQTAGQNQELAANGFSEGMKDGLQGNTDNLNAMLQRLGQPTQLDSHASQAGDVLYGLGGYTPGTNFSKEGAAFGSAAELQAGDVILKGQDNVKSIEAQKVVADQGFQNKIAEMAGKLPGDVQTNYMHLQTLALNDAKFRESVRKDNIDLAYKQSELKLAQLKYSTGVQEFNAKQTLAYAKLSNQEFQQNRDYQIKLQNLGIAQTKLQMAIVKNSFLAANGGLSKQAVSRYTSVAQSIAMDGVQGHTVYTTKNGVKTASLTPQLSYAESLSRILAKGVPVQIALDALDRAYPANQRPTPEILAKELGPLDPAALKQAAIDVQAPPGVKVPPGYDPRSYGLAPSTKQNPGGFLPIGQYKPGNTAQIVQIAKGMLGTPYVWGGNTPGKSLDCSGFVCQVYQKVGINLPRTTEEMVHAGRSVNLNQLQPGDLVFTEPSKSGPKHVGIYVGNGQIQESPHSGDVNKFIPIQAFLSGGFVAAKRILP